MIATGYLAGLVLDECSCFTAHSPWLTLKGLEMVFRSQLLILRILNFPFHLLGGMIVALST